MKKNTNNLFKKSSALILALLLTVSSATLTHAGQITEDVVSSKTSIFQKQENKVVPVVPNTSKNLETLATTVEAVFNYKRLENVENTSKYLSYYFNIDLRGTITEKSFFEAAQEINPDFKLNVDATDKDLSFNELLSMALELSNFDELAKAYTDAQVDSILLKYNIKNQFESNEARNIACALEINAISSESVNLIIAEKNINKEIGNDLLIFIAYSTGNAHNFIGYSNDSSIYSELEASYKRGITLSNDDLYKVGSSAVKDKVSTGFNLKQDINKAKFLPELTLIYGHSSLDHVKQLLSLLRTEEIVAKVQFEPKFSIYEYLIEWGPVPEGSPEYYVEEISKGFYLVNAYEYDLSLEFENKAEKEKFDSIILEFAKKNTDNDPNKSLILDSWWQPLYTSPIPMGDNYHLIYDNVVYNDGYSIHPFSLPENVESVSKALQTYAPNFEVIAEPIYCNSAFFRYLNGEAE